MGCLNSKTQETQSEDVHQEEIDNVINVSIEGNLAVGKSTLVKFLSSIPGICAATEPLEEWQSLGHPTLEGEHINLLDLMYRDKESYTFQFQVFAMLTQLRQHLQISQKVKVVERLMGSICFIRHAADCGNLNPAEIAILNEWKTMLYLHPKINMKPNLIVYLRASPEKSLERIRARGRPEEKHITLEFLREIHFLHEQWLIDKTFCRDIKTRVLVIDAEQDELQAAKHQEVKGEILSLLAAKGT